MAPWINNPPIQDQASTALEESVLRSSFFVHRSSKIKPRRPLGSTTSTNPHVQPFFKIKPKSPWRSVHHCSSKIKPKSPLKIRSNPPSRSSPRPLKNVHP
ncbi:hypothetical protein ACFX1S_004942 [Malus domestica]